MGKNKTKTNKVERNNNQRSRGPSQQAAAFAPKSRESFRLPDETKPDEYLVMEDEVLTARIVSLRNKLESRMSPRERRAYEEEVCYAVREGLEREKWEVYAECLKGLTVSHTHRPGTLPKGAIVTKGNGEYIPQIGE